MFETLKVFLRNRKALIGLIIVLLYVAVVVFGEKPAGLQRNAGMTLD